MCHLIICLSAGRFHLSVSLANLETDAVSKLSFPFLVEQIMRQQDLRCPFLVISGGRECYHNPSFLPPHPSPFTLSLSLFSHLCRPTVAQALYVFVAPLSSVSLPVYFSFFTLKKFFTFPFSLLLGTPSPPPWSHCGFGTRRD
ncbi:hypothetical protein ATANTOWER_029619 [Ataeniobius toweri]|uniref:Uncharacterized protein n=1 Tax=Ataeniobius toweri TaxID=208326 RepID=A0ABU7CD61_9TELE|nr:hypothetical protein [Ataeniobius toweri]